MAKKPDEKHADPVLATNRKAFHDYQVMERYEAGIKLTGTEVKSCRDRAIQLNDAYCSIQSGELWMRNLFIAVYTEGNRFNHNPKGARKMLLHGAEIRKLAQLLGTRGGTVVPLRFYLKGGLIKVEIAWCLGKNQGDKREDLRKREADREVRRMVRRG